jgi:prolyl-tRNA synthetase
MGLLAEHFADDKGLVWPEAVAPAKVYLARLGDADDVVKQADELYERLTASGVEVLYDDRDMRAGEKFADADLLGIPYRVVISGKTIAGSGYELKLRQAAEAEQVSWEKLTKVLGITG